MAAGILGCCVAGTGPSNMSASSVSSRRPGLKLSSQSANFGQLEMRLTFLKSVSPPSKYLFGLLLRCHQPMNTLSTLVLSLVMAWACGGCAGLGDSAGGSAAAAHGALQTPSDAHARVALKLLEAGDWNGAVGRATLAVAMDPENAAMHLLLATAHHRGYREGQNGQGDLAEAGYKVAVNLDPSNRQAVRNLGALYLDQQRYRAAQAALSRAVQLDDADGAVYYSLALAAYYARDLRTALWSVRKAADLHPADPAVLRGAAVIHAALNLPQEADGLANRYAGTRPDARDLASLTRTVGRWRRQQAGWLVAQAGDAATAAATPAAPVASGEGVPPLDPEAPNLAVSASQAPPSAALPTPPGSGAGGQVPTAAAAATGIAAEVMARDWRDCKQHLSDYDFRDDADAAMGQAGPAPGGTTGAPMDDETQSLRALPSPCKGLPLPRMVLVDAAILTIVEVNRQAFGVNLLDSLSIVLNGKRDVSRTLQSDGTWLNGDEKQFSVALGQNSAGVTYSLNIANASRNRVEVLARPTLVALDRKPSTFFSGADITVPVTGNFGGTLQDKAVGTSLSVTPTMLDEDALMLSAKAARSFIEDANAGSIAESLVTVRNSVTANVRMRYGQSLILSGLRESEGSKSHGGVPVLKDTPGLQYLFSHRADLAYEKNVLIVITPRRVESYDDVLNSALRGTGKDVPDAAFRGDSKRVQEQAAREETMLAPAVAAILRSQSASAYFNELSVQRADLGPMRVQSQRRFDLILRDLKDLLYF